MDFDAQATNAEGYLANLIAGTGPSMTLEQCQAVKAAASRLAKACVGVLENLDCCDCEDQNGSGGGDPEPV